jgi:hypothetical protein
MIANMKRREFILALGGAAAWPLAARAQQPDRMRLIGVLMGFVESDPAGQSAVAALRSALTKLGWTEGSNLRIERFIETIIGSFLVEKATSLSAKTGNEQIGLVISATARASDVGAAAVQACYPPSKGVRETSPAGR